MRSALNMAWYGKMHTTSAKYRAWEEDVRALGCVITGNPVCVIHHPVGRSAKHNKVHIGNWFILPLEENLHIGKISVHGNKKEFISRYGKQCELFSKVLHYYINRCGDHPVPNDVLLAIADWGK